VPLTDTTDTLLNIMQQTNAWISAGSVSDVDTRDTPIDLFFSLTFPDVSLLPYLFTLSYNFVNIYAIVIVYTSVSLWWMLSFV